MGLCIRWYAATGIYPGIPGNVLVLSYAPALDGREAFVAVSVGDLSGGSADKQGDGDVGGDECIVEFIREIWKLERIAASGMWYGGCGWNDVME